MDQYCRYLSMLLDYALECGLIREQDEIYAANRVLFLIGADRFERADYDLIGSIEVILNGLADYAAEHGKLENDTASARDILYADIMDCFTPYPSQVTDEFFYLYDKSPERSTEYFYKLSQDTNYIMTDRVKKDVKWTTPTEYGELIITINLSKPEKDPKDIAAAKNVVQSGYPKCLLCRENEGYEGHAAHPGRANHRIIPLTLCGEPWFFQYSPYVYYNEHCIVLNEKHTPMKIDRSTFKKLLDFVKQFPHYFIGSNADLPIVGGSILTHDHFQGGRADFPMALAGIREGIIFTGYEHVKAGILNWALSAIRLISDSPDALVSLSDKILGVWRGYSDADNDILAYTDAPHNTITPIARCRDGHYEMDLILRNNRTTRQHPLGIFHPHSEYHHIKKENIGLIEAMGLAVLPARLVRERNIEDASEREAIGQIFKNILENCGVYKNTQKGRNGFNGFIDAVNQA